MIEGLTKRVAAAMEKAGAVDGATIEDVARAAIHEIAGDRSMNIVRRLRSELGGATWFDADGKLIGQAYEVAADEIERLAGGSISVIAENRQEG
jgi:hypothetical protein